MGIFDIAGRMYDVFKKFMMENKIEYRVDDTGAANGIFMGKTKCPNKKKDSIYINSQSCHDCESFGGSTGTIREEEGITSITPRKLDKGMVSYTRYYGEIICFKTNQELWFKSKEFKELKKKLDKN